MLLDFVIPAQAGIQAILSAGQLNKHGLVLCAALYIELGPRLRGNDELNYKNNIIVAGTI